MKFLTFIPILALLLVSDVLNVVEGLAEGDPLELERKVINEVIQDKSKGFTQDHCKMLINQMKTSDQSTKHSRDVTAETEVAAETTWNFVQKVNSDKKNMYQEIIRKYVEFSSPFAMSARGFDWWFKNDKNREDTNKKLGENAKSEQELKQSAIENNRKLDEALKAFQKVRVEMASRPQENAKLGKPGPVHNVRITYRLNGYGWFTKEDKNKQPLEKSKWIYHDDSRKIPYGKTRQTGLDGNFVQLGDVITDKAFLSTSQNRQYMVKEPFDPVSQAPMEAKTYVKMVMLGYTGTPIGISIIRTTNQKEKEKEEKKMAKRKEKEETRGRTFDESSYYRRGNQQRAGEGEILYGRLTKWKVRWIDTSELHSFEIKAGTTPTKTRAVYVCLEQVQCNQCNLKSSFDGTEVSWTKAESEDFTELHEKVQSVRIKPA